MTVDSDFRERFQREADLAATLWHPHIVGVHDRGEFEGHLWISMDYVDGTDAVGKLPAMSTRRGNGEGSIYLRPDGLYEARLRYLDPATGKRKRISVYAPTPKAARANSKRPATASRPAPHPGMRPAPWVTGSSIGVQQHWRRRIARRPPRSSTPHCRAAT
jgi:hypothetical protein